MALAASAQSLATALARLSRSHFPEARGDASTKTPGTGRHELSGFRPAARPGSLLLDGERAYGGRWLGSSS